jgi:hypothetical protein
MYDGEFYDDSNTFLMQLYDVGMSSMVVQEAYALATLADAIGRPEAAMLRARGDAMSSLIADYLWDEEWQVYVNKFPNGTFYRRISPTSFYALQTKAPNDTQAAAMVERWLMNNKHFCVSPNGDFAGNDDSCYWGLPSIEASDAAYPPLGYWRGYIWGPMAQLTHWSLQNYDHVPAVRAGRKALAKQMGALMMDQWNQRRHIWFAHSPRASACHARYTFFKLRSRSIGVCLSVLQRELQPAQDSGYNRGRLLGDEVLSLGRVDWPY